MKSLLTVSVLVFVLFVSACTNNGGGNQQGNQEVTTTRAQGSEGGQQGGQPAVTTTTRASGGIVDDALNSISSAINAGQTYSCTYTYQGVQSQILIKGQKFKVKVNSGQETMNEVSDGAWIYAWGEGSNTGVKFKISATQDAAAQNQDSGVTSAGDIAQMAVNVRCVPSAASDNEFNPPSNVEFTDFSALSAGGVPGAGGDACSVCNMLSGEDKQACLASCGG